MAKTSTAVVKSENDAENVVVATNGAAEKAPPKKRGRPANGVKKTAKMCKYFISSTDLCKKYCFSLIRSFCFLGSIKTKSHATYLHFFFPNFLFIYQLPNQRQMQPVKRSRRWRCLVSKFTYWFFFGVDVCWYCNETTHR